jgi:cell division protein FtsB
VRVLVILGAIVLIGLQFRGWFSDVGFFERDRLAGRVEDQRRETERLKARNRILTAEVAALRDGDGAVEARARSELGMIKDGETFFLVTRPDDG